MKRHAFVLARRRRARHLRRGAAAAARRAGRPTKAEGTVLKGKAPVSKEVLRVKLPKPQEADLSNGVHLIVLEDHRTPQINFSMIIDGAGGYYDPATLPGLAPLHRVAHARGHDDQDVGADLGAARSAGRGGRASAPGLSSPFATVNGNG